MLKCVAILGWLVSVVMFVRLLVEMAVTSHLHKHLDQIIRDEVEEIKLIDQRMHEIKNRVMFDLDCD